MHSYLRSIGFSQCKTRKDIEVILEQAIENAEKKEITEDGETVFMSYEKQFSEDFGLLILGELNEQDEFKKEYYYPYLKGTQISWTDTPAFEKHAARESYAGICEDALSGVTLIFYLQNMMEYKKENSSRGPHRDIEGVILSGLSLAGSILLPVRKKEQDDQTRQEESTNRMNLMKAAKNGDEKAMENLTVEEIDTYSMVSRRIEKEDILSIVDTSIMPCGMESDQYSLLGEILDYRLEKNQYTGEQVYILHLDCKDICIDVCINEQDLLGEVAVGRRFKGMAWLQGAICYETM